MGHIGFLHSVQTLGAVDGPGLRFVAFLQGCAMRCAYCHNPDSWSRTGGAEITAEGLVARVARYKPYFGREGGLTLSGGEPLIQAEFCRQVARLCHGQGIGVCLDTAGSRCDGQVEALLTQVDLVLLDIKHADPAAFRLLTGRDMGPTLAFLQLCRQRGIPLWIRQVVAPGWTDGADQLRALLALVEGACVARIELLPYHTLGRDKWETLGRAYPMGDALPPSAQKMAELRAVVDEIRP